MVTGLVYTGVHGSTNQRREVIRVKRALTTRAGKISRMHRRTSGNQTAYANKAGRSLLQSIQKMETDILSLRKELDDQISEIMILRPLKDTAIDIRKRFFATYRRQEDGREAEDTVTIDFGNLRAHAGDVCLDVCLFKNRLIECDDTFATLYGLSWLKAESLIRYKQLVCAMNTRATTITNPRLWWNPDREAAFRNLVLWIGNVTTDEVEKVEEEMDKDTYLQTLFEMMECQP